jgi:general secretion pathway protein D
MVVALAAQAFTLGDDPAAIAPPIACTNGVPGGVSCVVSKKDLKRAQAAYARGMKLQERQQWEQAFTQFEEASHLVPQNTQFFSAREIVKAQLVYGHIERGNSLLMLNQRLQAATEFRAALNLDPDNQFAQERVEDATRDSIPTVASTAPWQQFASEIRLQPRTERATFHYRGDLRGLYTELVSAYGMTVQFDEALQPRQVRFNVEDVDFFTALHLAGEVTKTMWTALDAHQLLIAADNPENHKQYDRMSLQTFVLPAHSSQQEVTDMVTAMRNLFDLRFVSSGQTTGTVEVRAPQPMLAACTQLMAQLNGERPQVMLDVHVYQINHQLTRNIGLHIPDTFNLFNIPVAALAALGGQNIQQLINQLIASGGINQANNTALSSLLAQLGGQSNSIFSQPLATFGGGLTFEGLSLDQLSFQLSHNESWVRSLEHMTMRASQGNDATFHLGTRYPILNASYAPIYNSPQIAQVIGNQSYQAPFPSVSYEDLGLNLKAKPTIHGDGAVSLQLEMQVRSLTGQSSNGVPVISNREYKGSINLADGEPAVVAGEISSTDTRSMSGIPGLGLVPGLNQAMVNNTVEHDQDELLIVITPHVLANIERSAPEIWISGR